MTERTRWFSRQFTFDIALWAYPNLVERVRGTPARLEERLRGVDTPTLTRRAGDRWSVEENVGHLVDLESLWAARFDDFERGEERVRAADRQNRRTYEAMRNVARFSRILAELRRVIA